jgi:Fe-S oxidoreductase
MATYKAEFLSHYFARRLRPIAAYAFGLIHYWARLASLCPRVVNSVTQTPGLAAVAKLLVGMPQQRQIPAFAPFTFREWFRQQPPQPPAARGRVILWPDTFNNHFHPETAIAAVRVLQRAGFQVDIPAKPLCCGRPLFDYGMLDRARRWLHDVLDTLGADIQAGVPIVGLEPSCVAVFRDELRELFPDEQNAGRLARQTYLLSELLQKAQVSYPRLEQRAIVHGHCHHKAVMTMKDEQAVLEAVGLECTMLDSGCCGMAGSFGFERKHYDVSMQVGELVLLPAVRAAARDDLIVADGFSCRTQIAQASGRRALHLAEVLDMAATGVLRGPGDDLPEKRSTAAGGGDRLSAREVIGAGLILLGVAATLLARRHVRSPRSPEA